MVPGIFSKVDDYLVSLFGLEDEVLQTTEQSIREAGMPEHSVSANQGQFLYLLAKLCQAQRIVEIGTLGGYSSIWLGRALGNRGKLISVEIDPQCADLSRNNLAKAGLSDRVEVLTGAAMEVLQGLDLRGEPVDLFFMDADKPNYVAYFEWALEHARPGSLILADNVIRGGKVLDAKSKEEKVQGVRAYLEMLAVDERVETSVLQQVGHKEYDGLAISVVK